MQKKSTLLLVAWVITLLVSNLPTILLDELSGVNAPWLFWAKLALLALMMVLTFAWKKIRPLRFYFIILLILFPAEWLFSKIGEMAVWRDWFNLGSAGFTQSMLSTQLLRFGVALVMIALLLVLKRRRSAFFLVRGDLSAEAKPVRWLIDPGTSWKRLGVILSVCISLGTLAFLVIAGRPSLTVLGQALPLLPMVLLFAAMNAFSEELNYRASLLSTLEVEIGQTQALLLTAAFFGIGHYYGVPYGIVGVLMAGLLGWLLGKAMLETRGFFWPWFIHFWQDVLIFSFMAIGSVVAGGV